MRRGVLPLESSQYWNRLTPSPLGEGFYVPQSPPFPPQSPIYMPTSPPYYPVTPPPFFQPILPPSPLALPPCTFLLGTSPSLPLNLTLPTESLCSGPSQEVRALPHPSHQRARVHNPRQRMRMRFKTLWKDACKEFSREEAREMFEGVMNNLAVGACEVCRGGGWCASYHRCSRFLDSLV